MRGKWSELKRESHGIGKRNQVSCCKREIARSGHIGCSNVSTELGLGKAMRIRTWRY